MKSGSSNMILIENETHYYKKMRCKKFSDVDITRKCVISMKYIKIKECAMKQ